jgi:hypothetical protein
MLVAASEGKMVRVQASRRQLSVPAIVKAKHCLKKMEICIPDSLSFRFAIRAAGIPDVDWFHSPDDVSSSSKILTDFEKKNNISINIFGVSYSKGEVEIVRVSQEYAVPLERHVNLLFVTKGKRETICFLFFGSISIT